MVLKDWSYFDSEPGPSIKREALATLGKLQPDVVLSIQGVRRCGKSTFLTQIMKELELPSERCFFINFEDPRLSDSLSPPLLDALIQYADSTVGADSPRYFFLDEIQSVKEWEKWLRVKLDRPKQDFFIITGSNTSLLNSELATVLTGRHIPIEISPFSLKEYLVLKPKNNLQGYLQEGGFPKPLQIEESPRLLRQYFTDIIERDVMRNVTTRSSITLTQVTKAIFESTGSELSARTLTKKIDTTVDAMLSFLEALSQAYLILPCLYFTYSERKRLVRNTKWYPIDCGMRHSVITSGSSDIGKSFETIAYHALRRKHQEVFYWRETGEVDFVIIEGTTPRPIQVSWDGIKDRHNKALAEFAEKHPRSADPLIITKDNFLELF